MPNTPEHPTDPREYTLWLIEQLQERNRQAQKQLRRMTKVAGVDTMQKIYERTLQVEASGGLLTLDGKRRRTIGGAFFYLAREVLSETMLEAVFKPWLKKTRRHRKLREAAMDWSGRFNALKIISKQGTVNNMKVTLTGTPGYTVQSGTTVIVQMHHTVDYNHKQYPPGTPKPEFVPVVYTIYMAEKMWRKVKQDLEQPDALLEIKGICQFDPETQTIAVLAEYVGVEGADDNAKEKEPNTKKPAQEKQASPAKKAKKQAGNMTVPDDIPADVAAKAQELKTAIGKLQEKIASLKASKQTAGIKMTERLLENTESQLESLLSPYK